jgi:hypothetical protein
MACMSPTLVLFPYDTIKEVFDARLWTNYTVEPVDTSFLPL